MTNPLHLLTVAALLLVAFLVGAMVGTMARLLAMRLGRKPAVVVAAPLDVTSNAPPLVAAPVIAPLPVAPAPIMPAPADVPVPDFAATLIALANEAPPAAFIEASKPRVEPVSLARPMPEIRAIPAMAPLPAIPVAPSAAAMQPAHVAGETTSGVQVSAPQHENPADAQAEPAEQRTAEVILFPTIAAEPATARPTDIVVGGESVAVVDTSDLFVGEAVVEATAVADPVVVEAKAGHELAPSIAHDDHFRFVGTPAVAPPKAVLVPVPQPAPKSETIPIPAISANAAVGAVVTVDLPVPEVVETRVTAADPLTKPVAEPATPAPALPPRIVVTVPVVSTPAREPIMDDPEAVMPTAPPTPAAVPAPEPVASVPEPVADAPRLRAEGPSQAAESDLIVVSLDEPLDEDAAMRAIEGNWSPRRTPPKRVVRPAAEPEGANQAVAASARAVIAARRTAESVVAEVAEATAEVKAEAGRPAGLDGPRDGRKDDLTHIIGVLPVIETALNKLGLYHFDQVGGLTDEQIGWIEGHLGVPGRISRELWREQARELSAVLRPKRVAEK